jgi:hypothetical protein
MTAWSRVCGKFGLSQNLCLSVWLEIDWKKISWEAEREREKDLWSQFWWNELLFLPDQRFHCLCSVNWDGSTGQFRGSLTSYSKPPVRPFVRLYLCPVCHLSIFISVSLGRGPEISTPGVSLTAQQIVWLILIPSHYGFPCTFRSRAKNEIMRWDI